MTKMISLVSVLFFLSFGASAMNAGQDQIAWTQKGDFKVCMQKVGIPQHNIKFRGGVFVNQNLRDDECTKLVAGMRYNEPVYLNRVPKLTLKQKMRQRVGNALNNAIVDAFDLNGDSSSDSSSDDCKSGN